MALSVFNNAEVDAFSLQNPIRRDQMKSVRFMLAIAIVCGGSIFVNIQEADAGIFGSRRGGFRIFKRSSCKVRVVRSNRCAPCDVKVTSAPTNVVVAPPSDEVNPIDLVPKALIAPPIAQQEPKPPLPVVEAPPVVKPPAPVVKPPAVVKPVAKAETKPKVEETPDVPFTLAPTKRDKVDKTDTFEYPILPKIEISPDSNNLSPFVSPKIKGSWLKL